MTLIANLLILIAIAATVGLAWCLLPPNLPRGPDRSMYGMVCLIFQTPRWLCLTAALLMCVSRAAPFGGERGPQYAAVIVVQLLLGAGCLICVLTSIPDLDRPSRGTLAWLGLAFVVPLLQILFVTWVMNATPRVAAMISRPGWIAFSLLALGFGVAGATIFLITTARETRERAEQKAASEAAVATEANAEEAAFGALTLADPLAAWLPYTAYGQPDARRAAAAEAIGRRPALPEELEHELASGDFETERRANYAMELLPADAAARVAEPFARYATRLVGELQVAAAEADVDAQRGRFVYADARASAYMAAARGLHRGGVDVRPQLASVVEAARPADVAGARNIVRVYDYYLHEFSTATPTTAGAR